MKRQSERVAVLALLVAVLIAITMLLLQERRMNKATLLNYQLQALRTSVNLYKAIERKNPANLNDLFTGTFRFPESTTDRRFATCPNPAEGDGCLDPFGNSFRYDAETGWVSSSTRPYMNW